MLWIGADVGGTFTDLVVFDDATGAVASTKVPSTPSDPATAVLDAVRAAGVDLQDARRFAHGATVATNTALERDGAKLGVVTTRGFRDVLIVGRGNRLKVYDIKAVREEALVRRTDVREVNERMDAEGDVRTPLDEAAVADAVRELVDGSAEAIVIGFINSYVNPAHELRAAEIARAAAPGVAVIASAEAQPEYREYERFATASLTAYVAPKMSAYLTRLQDLLKSNGLANPMAVMSSAGGAWPAARMAARPANSMLSGPAAGAIAATRLAEATGKRDLITFDMGGTSTDVALIRDGRYEMTAEGEIGGLPNRTPQIAISTFGIGGGSLAYLEAGGFLHVGPRSAGASPGPAAYGRGGIEPTVTDANVALGRIGGGQLGGAINLDRDAAVRALMPLAEKLGLSLEAAAEGVIELALVKVAGAIREISVMRGLDPRDFALVAFGGAGPLHAALAAEMLEMERVIVPPLPGAFSAFGLISADARVEHAQSVMLTLPGAELSALNDPLDALAEAACAQLIADGHDADRITAEIALDMRYLGQSFEIRVDLSRLPKSMDEVLTAFEAAYSERYVRAGDGPVEIVTARVTAIGAVDKPPLAPPSDATTEPRRTRAWASGQWLDLDVVPRAAIDGVVAGPVIIDDASAVIYVPPGFDAETDAAGALHLIRRADR